MSKVEDEKDLGGIKINNIDFKDEIKKQGLVKPHNYLILGDIEVSDLTTPGSSLAKGLRQVL